MKGKGGQHPGFKSVQQGIAKKEGVSEKEAGAMLASSSRKASPASKAKNPKLNKVKGKDKVTRAPLSKAFGKGK